MKRFLIIFIVIFWVDILFGIPDMMNYQGRAYSPPGSLNPVPDSTGNTIIVRIYANETDPIGSQLWQKVIYNVQTKNGYFNIQFGGFGSVLNFNQDYWLGIEFNGDGEMTPRQKLLSAPYAQKARFVEQVDSYTKILGPISVTGTSNNFAVMSVTNTSGAAVSARGVTGIIGISDSSSGIGIYAKNNMGTSAVALRSEGASYFLGPVTITANVTSGSINIYNNSGVGLGAFIKNDSGGAAAFYGGPGYQTNAVVNVSATANAHGILSSGKGNYYGVYGYSNENAGVCGYGYYAGVSGAASYMSGAGVYGFNTSTASATGIGVRGDVTGPYSYGVYGLNLFSGNGNFPYTAGVVGESLASLNGIGVRGTGYYGVYAKTNNSNGIGIFSDVNSTADAIRANNSNLNGFALHSMSEARGLDTGASLYVQGKIKMAGGGSVNSPVGRILIQPADGPNPQKSISNNLCYGNYHVFITPQTSGDPVTANNGKPISWWVETMSGGFTLHVETGGYPLDNVAYFSYLIINE